MNKADHYIVKAKTAGVADALIAGRLGMPVEEVMRRWERIKADHKTFQANGYVDLTSVFQNLAAQYKLLGETMKELADILDNTVNIEELARMVTDSKAETLANLSNQCIILHSFKPKTPVNPLKN